MSPYPKLQAWIERIEARPAAYAGLGIPSRKKVALSKEEQEKEAKEGSSWVMRGQPK